MLLLLAPPGFTLTLAPTMPSNGRDVDADLGAVLVESR